MYPSGSGPVVVEPWQTRLPVRRQKPQGVPPLAAPPFGDAAALEDDVVDAGLDQVPAHREPGLTAADNDHIRTSHDLSSSAGLKARTTALNRHVDRYAVGQHVEHRGP